jgi:hypothetical protein
MTPNRGWMTFGALLLAAFAAAAFVAPVADASEDVAFDADFIEVSGDYYLAIRTAWSGSWIGIAPS